MHRYVVLFSERQICPYWVVLGWVAWQPWRTEEAESCILIGLFTWLSKMCRGILGDVCTSLLMPPTDYMSLRRLVDGKVFSFPPTLLRLWLIASFIHMTPSLKKILRLKNSDGATWLCHGRLTHAPRATGARTAGQSGWRVDGMGVDPASYSHMQVRLLV
jgi:hypothetical protein